MSSKKLPARASLENLRKQAKGLHKAFADGDDAAVTRIQEHLPRAATLTDDALRATALSLQKRSTSWRGNTVSVVGRVCGAPSKQPISTSCRV